MTDIIHEDAARRDKTVNEAGTVPYLHADDDLTCARCWPRAELIKHANRAAAAERERLHDRDRYARDTAPTGMTDIAAIRERHQPDYSETTTFCKAYHDEEWPCDTRQVLDHADRLAEALRALIVVAHFPEIRCLDCSGPLDSEAPTDD